MYTTSIGMADRNVQAELIQLVLDKFLELNFAQGWRLWLNYIHRSSYGQHIPLLLPEPTGKMKLWASLLLILWFVMTIAWISVIFTMDAVQADLTPEGRFREVYAIPRVIGNIKAVLIALASVRLLHFLNLIPTVL
ncbi:uncharacterized protein LOC117322193 [Pecten maximus]|uniref:uncharacterized protein LOC117322193 n=1 Tax=Pecten maximus TaxID=6579 RepID=UPI001458349E|nr:uncharacterized protein LOC117322193 [Pecten maximus]